MSADILQEIPDDEIPALRQLCIEQFPTGVHIYNFLTNVIRWRRKYPDAIKIFAPDGNWKSDGTFITNLKLPSGNDMFVFTLEASCERLYMALRDTKQIVWDGKKLIGPVCMQHCSTIQKICDEKNISLYGSHECYVWILPKDKALQLNTECSEDVYIKQLSSFHATTINNVWPHTFPNSEIYIQKIIDYTRGYGVFLKSNDELVSWALMNQLGAIGFLQTADEHKRKGFAALITRFVAKKFAEMGLDPYGTSLIRNTSVAKMFRNIGFQSFEHCVFFETYTDRSSDI